MDVHHIPVAFKLAYTLFVLYVMAVLWRHYGWKNFLLFSDIAFIVSSNTKSSSASTLLRREARMTAKFRTANRPIKKLSPKKAGPNQAASKVPNNHRLPTRRRGRLPLRSTKQ